MNRDGIIPPPASEPLSLADLGVAALAAIIGTSAEGVLVLDAQQRIRFASPAACDILGETDLSAVDLIARAPERERDELRSSLTLRSARPVRRSTTLLRPNGDRREVEYVVVPCVAAEPLILLSIRDVSEIRQMMRWAAALARIASSAAYAGTLEMTLTILARTLVRVTGLAACTVVLIDDTDHTAWRAAASYGLPEGYTEALEAAWHAGVPLPSVRAYEQRQPILARDVRRRVLDDPRAAPLHPLIDKVTWDVTVAVPLVVRGRSIGALVGYYTPEQPPSEAEIAFLSSIADQAAVAVENARLFVEAQGKAALEERQKLARELHDSVSQALYGISLGARTARELLERDPSQVAGPLEYVASLADAGLAEMRALIFELRPESLASEGVVAALVKQAASLRARHGLVVETSLGDEPDVALHVKEAIYRIAQEALHNIVRHAHASNVHLSLEATPDAIVLRVRDDGQGFDPSRAFPGHLGLRSMHERAESLGGHVELVSTPDTGTCVTACFPHGRTKPRTV